MGGAALFSRLARTGLPNLAASALILLTPIAAAGLLPTSTYALWALATTVATIGLAVDFGAPAVVISDAVAGPVRRTRLLQTCGLTTLGSMGVACVAALAWLFTPVSAGLPYEGAVGALILGLVGGATTLRGILVLQLSLLLAAERYTQRAALLVAQALAQTVLVVALLPAWPSPFVLPVAATISCFLPILLALPSTLRLTTRLGRADGQSAEASLRLYAWSRSLVSLLSLALTQVDRWILAAIATPAFLTAYDVSARIASIPRFGALAVSAVLVVEGAQAAGNQERLKARLHQATRLLLVFIAAMSVVVIGASLLLSRLTPIRLVPLSLLVAMLLWYGANALTAPVTLFSVGAGMPQLELRYLVPCFALTVLAWTAGVMTHDPKLTIVVAGIALAVTSLAFLALAPGVLNRWSAPQGGKQLDIATHPPAA